ncbi:MAG: GH3 auxin-responsive promoter family protein [Ferruginibacter sp.]
MQMYFGELMEKSGKKIEGIVPEFQCLMVQGGVNYEPYKAKLTESIGRHVDTIELFPASEGFFAFQDTQTEAGILLNSNSGIFFEFIPVSEMGKPNPVRLTLKDVKVGENYAIIISSNAGLWAYNIGDTVKFVWLTLTVWW